jgi:hypothetical protein
MNDRAGCILLAIALTSTLLVLALVYRASGAH